MRCTLVLLVAGVCAARAGVHYCGAKMCGFGNSHTFCQYAAGPSPYCRGYMDAALTIDEKARIVSRLNRRRGEAASGRLRNFAPAGNMLKLRWVEELAREAQRWADQCRPPGTPDERDACRDLFSTSVGQCVASVVGEAPGLRVESMVDVWYMQSILYKGNVTYYDVPMSNVSFYGDFAQMIWSRSYMVGCGRSRFMSEVNGRLRSVERLVCNIAPRGPPPARALWTPAAPTSLCPPRSEPDTNILTLCNYQRDLDASADQEGAMSLEEHVLLSILLEIENKKALDYLGSLDELYMTKLAAITLESPVATESYINPLHKRDLIERLGLDENIVRIDNVIIENDINQFMNATRIIVRVDQTTPQEIVTKKLNVIGRPKSYNVEDLNAVDGDVKSIQDMNDLGDLPRRVVTKIDRDIYLDYEFVDDSTENTVETPSANTTNDFQSNSNTMMMNKVNESLDGSTITESTLKVTTNLEEGNFISYPDQANSNNTVAPMNNIFSNASNNMNGTVEVPFRSDDDYLNDPETVRQLQEALDRIEKSMGEQNSVEKQSSGKVRRELRNVPGAPPEALNEVGMPDFTDNDVNSSYNEQENHHDPNESGADQGDNRTDKNPMLNMVLRYLPYLKPYQKEILGGPGSSASSLAVSYVLFSFGVVFTFSSL